MYITAIEFIFVSLVFTAGGILGGLVNNIIDEHLQKRKTECEGCSNYENMNREGKCCECRRMGMKTLPDLWKDEEVE